MNGFQTHLQLGAICYLQHALLLKSEPSKAAFLSWEMGWGTIASLCHLSVLSVDSVWEPEDL